MTRVDEIRVFRIEQQISRKKEELYALEQDAEHLRAEIKDLELRRDLIKNPVLPEGEVPV